MVAYKNTVRESEPLDLSLIRKYSIPGPRYTSYPPATKFTSAVEPLIEQLERDNAADAGPLSLYFHLPFCESLCWYCGCNTVITRDRSQAARYVEQLAREITLTAAHMNVARPVKQIHFGGGTPTFLPPIELLRIGGFIRDQFNVAKDCEFGVEIDPRRLTQEHVGALLAIGANRASLGIQDTNPQVQLAIHRWQPSHLNEQAMSWLRGAGFKSINVDLIFGLPQQNVGTFSKTIDDVLALSPDRLSVFSYAHIPWMKPAQKIFDSRGSLPNAEEKLAMFAVAHERLTEAGFIDIGLDHFARPDDELALAQKSGTLHRNFQGYSTAADASLYGFGVSSISSTQRSYRQSFKDIDQWNASIDQRKLPIERGLVLDDEDLRRRAIIMRLMCMRRLNFADLSRELGVDVADRYRVEIAGLSDLEADGIIKRDPQGIEVTPRGSPLLRVVAMRFDATFAPVERQHSQTI